MLDQRDTIESMRRDQDLFLQRLGDAWTSRMASEGFAREGWQFRRVEDPSIQCVDIQCSDDYCSCYVNLGAHFTFLEDYRGKFPNPATIETCACQFQDRLRGTTGGFFPYRVKRFWEWKGAEVQLERAAEQVMTAFEHEGLARLRAISDLSRFTEFRTTDVLDETTFREFGVTGAGAADILAQIHKYCGDRARAGEFAELGISLLSGRVEPNMVERLHNLVRWSTSDGESLGE